MPEQFLLTAAPSGSSWEHVLRPQAPQMDPNGLVTGHWGEAMHYAVLFERTNNFSEMPGYEAEGPAGQILNFLDECRYSAFKDALALNEERTKQSMDNGNQNFAFQLMAGQPTPQTFGQPMGAPQQQMMGTFVQVNGFQILGSLPKVKIEEKMNMLETAAGLFGELMGIDAELEMANKYVIRTEQGHPLFFAVEQTDFCNRQCGGDCRGIDIDMVVLGQDPNIMAQADGNYDWSFNPFPKVDLTGSQKFIHLHKDCQCTCCCFNRPIINVTDGNTGQIVGKIKNPWACCDMTFDLMDANDQPTLTSKGGCCQLGLICPCPCGPCKEVNFDVKNTKSGDEVAHLKKIIPSCMKFVVADDVDNYDVDFGSVQDPQLKAMLVALGLFIDFRYFNVRSDKNDEAADGFNWD